MADARTAKPAPTGVAASYLAINAKTKDKDAAFTFWTEFLSAEGQTFRLTGGGNAVPSIKGADEVVLEDNYPTHAQTFLDMRDIGFANYAAEGAVPGTVDRHQRSVPRALPGQEQRPGNARQGRGADRVEDRQMSTTLAEKPARVNARRSSAQATAPGMRKEAGWRGATARWGYVFVGPQVIGMVLFVLVPFAASLVLAFAEWDGLTDLTWVGFENFTDQLRTRCCTSRSSTPCCIALITVPIGLGLAVVIAVALEKLKTRTLYLILFFAPVVTSTVAVAMIWQQMFRADGVLQRHDRARSSGSPRRTGWATRSSR